MGHQFCVGPGARSSVEAHLLCQQGLVRSGDEIPVVGEGGVGSSVLVKRLRHYFHSFTVLVMTNLPIQKVLQKPNVAGRMVRWTVELSEFDIQYEPRESIKGQFYADFVAELSPGGTLELGLGSQWLLSVDGSSNQQESGAGIVLEGPYGVLIEQAVRFAFKASNYQAKYEALIAGMLLAKEMGVQSLVVKSDSQLVTGQVIGEYHAKDPQMEAYLK